MTEKISAEDYWVCQVKDEVETLKNTSSSTESKRWKKQSVYRIPSSVKDLCKSIAYSPHTVSIGPYHHDDQHLKAMDEHKRRALTHFLSRSSKPLEVYHDALAQVVDDLKDAYDKLDNKWKQNNKAFLQLMLEDGCFVLELLRATTAKPEELKQMGYADNDPVFSNHGRLYIVPYLKRDMLMLENQLPMLVLTTLLANENDMLMFNDLSKLDELKMLILDFFTQPSDINKINELGECFHILDVYRKNLLWNPANNEETKTAPDRYQGCCGPPKQEQRGDQIICSATELYEAGVTIEPSNTRSLKDISFHCGVLKLPPILVDDTLESQYLNLMAFERFHAGAGNEVSSYIFFMDNIIDSARDVSLLHSSGIIQNALGSDKAVANLFNTISKDIVLDPDSSLEIVHQKVSEYCSRTCPRWMASLRHTYFDNPWVSISVIAAIILFVLTGIQTYYSVIGYYHSK